MYVIYYIIIYKYIIDAMCVYRKDVGVSTIVLLLKPFGLKPFAFEDPIYMYVNFVLVIETIITINLP